MIIRRLFGNQFENLTKAKYAFTRSDLHNTVRESENAHSLAYIPTNTVILARECEHFFFSLMK